MKTKNTNIIQEGLELWIFLSEAIDLVDTVLEVAHVDAIVLEQVVLSHHHHPIHFFFSSVSFFFFFFFFLVSCLGRG